MRFIQALFTITAVILLSACPKIQGEIGPIGPDGPAGDQGAQGPGKPGFYVSLSSTDIVVQSAFLEEIPEVRIISVISNDITNAIDQLLTAEFVMGQGFEWTNTFAAAINPDEILNYSITIGSTVFDRFTAFCDAPRAVSFDQSNWLSNGYNTNIMLQTNGKYSLELDSMYTDFLVSIQVPSAGGLDSDFHITESVLDFEAQGATNGGAMTVTIQKEMVTPVFNHDTFFVYEDFSRPSFTLNLTLTN